MEQRSSKARGSSEREGRSLSLDQLKEQLRQKLELPRGCDSSLLGDPILLGGEKSHLSSGVAELDNLLGGGFPLRKLTEIRGDATSGRTSLALATAALATRQNHLVAWADINNCLDPHCVEQAGVAVERFIWLRFPEMNFERRAFRAAEEIVRGQSIQLLVLDLVGKRRLANRSQQWIRLKKALRETSMACLILNDKKHLSLGADLTLFCSAEDEARELGSQRLCTIEIRRQRFAAPGQRATVLLAPFAVA